MPIRLAALAVSAFFACNAQAQVTPSQQVLALAPQLQAFAGSPANFDSLASGLVQGIPATLQTVTADGVLQTVTLNPPAALGALQAARTLETARQLLISRGIGSPTAEQIGVALAGGALPTPLGVFRTPGVLTGRVDPNALAVQRQAAPAAATPFGGSAANFQSLNAGLTQGRPITLTSIATNGAAQPVTFRVPGAPLNQAEASDAILVASQLLAAQGIANPTPQQIQTALLGGTLASPAGNVAVRGVLQDRASSPATITGASTGPVTGVSSASLTGVSSASITGASTPSLTGISNGSAQPAGPGSAGAGPNGAPSATAQLQRQDAARFQNRR